MVNTPSVFLTYQYRILPTKAQHRVLERILEDQRQLYNAALEERIAYYRCTGKTRTYVDQSAALTSCRAQVAGMSDLPVKLQRHTLKRLDKAYRAFFRRVKKGGPLGFPRFRGRGWFDSFGFSEWSGVHLIDGRLHFKGMLGGLRIHLHRQLPTTRPLGCVLKRDTKGWSVYFRVQIEAPTKRPIAKAVGMDLGLKTLAALSDGVLIPNPRAARKSERVMRLRQRQLARCKRGSGRRRKVRASLAKLHAKIANTRATYLHQQSAMLVRTYDLIAIEALNIGALSRTFLARSIHDASWGTLVNLIRYKAERAGAHLIEVDPKRTSQECPRCGSITRKALSNRWHSCECGSELDRDIAAAQVILSRAVVSPEAVNVAHTWGERRPGNIGHYDRPPTAGSVIAKRKVTAQ